MDILKIPHQEKVNAIVDYINNDLSGQYAFVNQLSGVSVASDAFFPFSDNIDVASEFGCKYIVQPGGSVADDKIIETCNKHNIVMCMTGNEMRMFLH